MIRFKKSKEHTLYYEAWHDTGHPAPDKGKTYLGLVRSSRLKRREGPRWEAWQPNGARLPSRYWTREIAAEYLLRALEAKRRLGLTTPGPRSITDVIDRILTIAPDLKSVLKSVRNSAGFTAPEAMTSRWVELCEVLTEHATGHEQEEKIRAVVNGTE